MDAARRNRWGHRDATIVLIAYRHGLRASELVGLRWDQVGFEQATLHVRRVKQGTPSVHPLTGQELRALRRLHRESPASPFVFVSERNAPFSTAGFGAHDRPSGEGAARLGLKVHHMLRHACGFALANAGRDTRALQAYLGHRNIQHTVRFRSDLFQERSARPRRRAAKWPSTSGLSGYSIGSLLLFGFLRYCLIRVAARQRD